MKSLKNQNILTLLTYLMQVHPELFHFNSTIFPNRSGLRNNGIHQACHRTLWVIYMLFI
jgi:hypothetical protein